LRPARATAAPDEVGGDGGQNHHGQPLPAKRPASCQRVPNSPPPRMLATTLVPPRSSQSLPIAEL